MDSVPGPIMENQHHHHQHTAHSASARVSSAAPAHPCHPSSMDSVPGPSWKRTREQQQQQQQQQDSRNPKRPRLIHQPAAPATARVSPAAPASPGQASCGDLGYSKETVMKYRLISSSLHVGYDKSHILMKATGESGKRKILQEICEKQNSCSKPDITPEYLIRNTDIGKLILRIMKNFKFVAHGNLLMALEREEDSKPDHSRKRSVKEIENLLLSSPYAKKREVQAETKVEQPKARDLRPIPLGNVICLVDDFLKKVVKRQVFGSKDNVESMRWFVVHLLQAGKYEKVELGKLMERINMKAVRWTRDLPMEEKGFIVSKFCMWIADLCLSTVKAYVYAVYHENEVCFYRKESMEACFQGLINDKVLKCVDDTHTQSEVGSLRLIPKRGGVRPIFLCRNNSLGGKEALDKCKLLLRTLVYKDTLKTKPPFHAEFYEAIKSLAGDGSLFFVKTDIQDAFGSVDNQKLLSLLQEAMAQLSNTDISNYQKVNKKLKCVITLKERRRLLEVIEAALHPVVCLGKRRVTLVSGLPQGMALSSDLLEFYITKMLLEIHRLTSGGQGVLLRATDDLLFMSRSRDNTEEFMAFIDRGISSYNFTANKAKTLSSWTPSTERVLFNGHIICFSTQAVLVNPRRLLSDPRNTITFNLNKKSFSSFIEEKLIRLSIQCLPRVALKLCVPMTLAENVWRLGLLIGHKIEGMLNYASDGHLENCNSEDFVTPLKRLQKALFNRLDAIKQFGYKLFVSFLNASIYLYLCLLPYSDLLEKVGKYVENSLKNVERTPLNRNLLDFLTKLVQEEAKRVLEPN